MNLASVIRTHGIFPKASLTLRLREKIFKKILGRPGRKDSTILGRP